VQEEPPQVLRGFETTAMLSPGGADSVTFPLGDHDTSIWNTEAGTWEAIKGEYTVKVGASSRDIRLTAKATF
jgi:beta-glucosidase